MKVVYNKTPRKEWSALGCFSELHCDAKIYLIFQDKLGLSSVNMLKSFLLFRFLINLHKIVEQQQYNIPFSTSSQYDVPNGHQWYRHNNDQNVTFLNLHFLCLKCPLFHDQVVKSLWPIFQSFPSRYKVKYTTSQWFRYDSSLSLLTIMKIIRVSFWFTVYWHFVSSFIKNVMMPRKILDADLNISLFVILKWWWLRNFDFKICFR